jgi:hypothetical protein
MKYKKEITILVITIAALSLFAAVCGLIPGSGRAFDFTSIHGQTVSIFGRGLYRFDSVSSAAQTRAQDLVTLFLGIPLLAVSLLMSRRGLTKGRLLLTGTLGYFLYTYASYAFLMMYNPLFLVYVALMSLSFFGFVLGFMSFDVRRLSECFDKKLPVKFIGGILIFIAVMIGLMWLGRIVPPLAAGGEPQGLEHYATLVIQALDLGFVVPSALIAGILLIRRRAFGYLLAPVIIIKGVTLVTAVIAMAVMMAATGVAVSFVEMGIFILFGALIICSLYLIMKNINENSAGGAV